MGFHFSSYLTSLKLRNLAGKKNRELELTQYKNLFHVGSRKRIGNPKLGHDDQGTMDSGPKPEDVCMPPKCASLACEGEVVHINLARLNWALGYVCWPISPTSPQLSNTMPEKKMF